MATISILELQSFTREQFNPPKKLRTARIAHQLDNLKSDDPMQYNIPYKPQEFASLTSLDIMLIETQGINCLVSINDVKMLSKILEL